MLIILGLSGVFVASCSNDTASQSNVQEGQVGNTVIFQSEEIPSQSKRDAMLEPQTRTSITHVIGQGAKPYWSTGDKIWVEDTGGTFRQSAAGNFNATLTYGTFLLTGTFSNGCIVNYTGSAGTAGNQVTIASTQTQTAPNDFSHAGAAGDCGTATASGDDNGFTFKLSHKAAYLCLLPRTTNEFVKRSKITKIEIVSEDDIAGTYDFVNGSLASTPSSGGSKTITLTTGSGFEIDNEAYDIAKNGAYVVIAPGIHRLAIRYWLKNETDNPDGTIEGTITKYVTPTCNAGEICDIKSILKLDDHAPLYYMWDAKEDYWYGNESNQPKKNNNTGTGWPASYLDSRWYNPVMGPTQASNSAKDCPNVNEMLWYALKGDPHWDADELWTCWGYLYKGGMWLLKRDNIDGFDSEKYRNRDWRQINDIVFLSNSKITQSRPTTSELSKYFYLPATGYYFKGELNDMGVSGRNQTSSPSHYKQENAMRMTFSKTLIAVQEVDRVNAYPSLSFN